ncbi:MAG: DUF2264 domain-containing protein [Bacteroidota bacterium]|nr:DUF2264 domain-containing protein [Bacteroidota bacterium]
MVYTRIKLFLFFLLLVSIGVTNAQTSTNVQLYTQQKRVKNEPLFKVVEPDYTVSPFTGMTRKHWKDAALYLLRGAFSYVDKMDDPMQFPKMQGKSYPRIPEQVPTEKLEGLCRTLFLAAPLLKEDSSLEINHIKVADYYRYQICKLIDSTSPSYIKPRPRNGGPHQNLVEFGGLSVSLFAIPEILWKPLPQQQKDKLAALMLSYGDGPTVPQNWKFFNIFILSFYKSQGYSVNEKLLVEYLDKVFGHYRGSGWYDDGPAYDYYSMWAFQMYGMLWSNFFGEKYYPDYARRFRLNFKPMKDNYPYMFARDGKMIMWGRSISYRMGAVIPFPLMGLENDPFTNYGWMRRISSGAILQFLQNPSFLQNNIPTLGFYGPFEPAVQSYSCRGSVFWMGKAFLGLLIPDGNPFWNAKENEGPWEKKMQKGQVYNKLEEGSYILITDYPNIGAAEIRAWCHVPVTGAAEPYRGAENYNRLSYNSAFPWQADGKNGEVAMNYVFLNKKNEWEPFRLYDFKRYDEGCYYRDVSLESDPNIKANLTDITLPNGILRVDRLCTDTSVAIRLGHYALANTRGAIREQSRTMNGYTVKIIDNGEYQLAMVVLKGWKEMEIVKSHGLNPVANESKVIDATDRLLPSSPKLYITLMLWKKSGEKWTDEELVPVRSLQSNKNNDEVIIQFKNGTVKSIHF